MNTDNGTVVLQHPREREIGFQDCPILAHVKVDVAAEMLNALLHAAHTDSAPGRLLAVLLP